VLNNKKNTASTFHYDTLGWNIKKTRSNHNKSPERTRSNFLAITLLVALLGYSAYFYVPAYMSPARKLLPDQLDRSAVSLADQSAKAVIAKHLTIFKTQRAYLRKGQSIRVQYALPEDAEIDLSIIQCQRIFFIETFKCIPKHTQTIKVKDKTIGTYDFSVNQVGFYAFADSLVTPKDDSETHAVIWRRR